MWLIARKLNSHQLHPLHLDRGITDVILPQATVLIVCQCNSYSINTATVYTLGIFSGIKSWRFDSKRKKTYRRKRLQTANKLRNSRKGFPLLAQKVLCLCPSKLFGVDIHDTMVALKLLLPITVHYITPHPSLSLSPQRFRLTLGLSIGIFGLLVIISVIIVCCCCCICCD